MTSYTVRLDIKGNLNISLTDFNGQPYDFTTNADGSITFNLDDEYDGMGLFGITTDPDDAVDVVYRATQISNVATTTPTQSIASPTATTSTKPNSGVRVLVSPAAALLGFVFMLLTNIN
jgi:hypothetical protein